MDSFTSMKTKLAPIGLYEIEAGSNIYAELKAYAAGLDDLFDNLGVMLRECFISTAESYGLSEREKLIGAEREDYSTEARREMLINREQTIGLACTYDAYIKILKSYGLTNFTLTENCSGQSVSIVVRDSLSSEIKSWISQRIEDDFPSHLTINVTYSS